MDLKTANQIKQFLNDKKQFDVRKHKRTIGFSKKNNYTVQVFEMQNGEKKSFNLTKYRKIIAMADLFEVGLLIESQSGSPTYYLY